MRDPSWEIFRANIHNFTTKRQSRIQSKDQVFAFFENIQIFLVQNTFINCVLNRLLFYCPGEWVIDAYATYTTILDIFSLTWFGTIDGLAEHNSVFKWIEKFFSIDINWNMFLAIRISWKMLIDPTRKGSTFGQGVTMWCVVTHCICFFDFNFIIFLINNIFCFLNVFVLMA